MPGMIEDDPMLDTLTRQFYVMTPAQRRPEKRQEERALVAPWRVSPSLRAAAQRALHHALMALPLDGAMSIRWMAPPSEPGARIMAPAGRMAYVEPIDHPTEIFLHVAVPDPVATVLHEARHHWQYRHDWYPDPDPCDVPGCGHPSYTLSPEDEDRIELDANVWAALEVSKWRL